MGIKESLIKFYQKQLLENAKKDSAYGSFYVSLEIGLNITTKCNFRCKHCYRNIDDARDMPFEVAEKVILEAKKYKFKHVGLTGGEALLYPRFKELIELIVRNDCKFSIVTNGWVFRQFSDFLKQYRNNIVYVKFSLESRKKELHDSLRNEGSFDRLVDDFQLCRQSKIPFRTITAVNLLNYGEIVDIGIFVKRQGAQFVSFTTMLPCPNTQKNKLVLDAAKRQELFFVLKELHKIIKLPVIITTEIRAYSNIALCDAFQMYIVFVDVNGNLTRCCVLSDYDSECLAKSGIITSLKDKTFGEGLKKLSEYISELTCARIEDYKKHPDPEHIDFNSCFYCIHKLDNPPKS